MEARETFWILKPCRTDNAFKLRFRGRSYPTQMIVRKLIAGLNAQLVAETPMLKVVKHGSALISIHANGDLLLRNIHTDAAARELAERIANAIAAENQG